MTIKIAAVYSKTDPKSGNKHLRFSSLSDGDWDVFIKGIMGQHPNDKIEVFTRTEVLTPATHKSV